MKNRCIAALLLALWSGSAVAATIDVKVYDAFGAAYPSTRIGEELGALYNLGFKTTLVLILGPNLEDERVNRQKEIVDDIDPNRHGILFAIGTPVETYTRGFSITPNDAAELLPARDSFRVLVLGPAGRVLHESSEVIPREQLIRIAPGS